MNLDPDGYWFNAQNGAPQDASELKALLGCNGTLKIVETTDNFLYCRYVCSKCSFDSWHTMSTTAHKNHDKQSREQLDSNTRMSGQVRSMRKLEETP